MRKNRLEVLTLDEIQQAVGARNECCCSNDNKAVGFAELRDAQNSPGCRILCCEIEMGRWTHYQYLMGAKIPCEQPISRRFPIVSQSLVVH